MNRFLSMLLHAIFVFNLSYAITLYQVDHAPFGKGSVNAVNWVTKDNNSYIIYGGNDAVENQEIRVSEFIVSSEILYSKASAHFSDEDNSHVNSVDSIIIGNKIYVAAGGRTGNSGKEIVIYEYTPSDSQLKTRELMNFENGQVYGVKWLEKDGNYYLAVGGGEITSGDELRVYYFDPINEELHTLYGAMDNFYHGAVHAVDWIISDNRVFLAVAGTEIASIMREIRVYEFDSGTGSLVLLSTASYGNSVHAIEWHEKDGNLYLATGGNDAFENKEVRVFNFDTANDTLSQIADASFSNGIVNAVAWHEQNNDLYLTVGGDDGVFTKEVRIYNFDTMLNKLTEVQSVSFDDGVVRSLSWKKINTTFYLAVGGKNNYYGESVLRIFKAIH